jgi:hypothetical protein
MFMAVKIEVISSHISKLAELKRQMEDLIALRRALSWRNAVDRTDPGDVSLR